MTDDIWVWGYELTSAAALNSVSQRTSHRGALIRVGAGYGCLHPWPELGDEPLEAQLESLEDGCPTPLAAIAMTCASVDGVARSAGVNLFDEVDASVPESHWLYQDGDDLSQIRGKGFSTVKVKIGPSSPRLSIIEAVAQEGLVIRLDANGSFPFALFCEWWGNLSAEVRQKIEFVEDPVPWNWWNWSHLEQSGVPLAVDRDLEKRRKLGSWAVYKPAVIQDSELISWIEKRGGKLSVTSYMDHPLGQMWAAFCAQKINRGEPEFLGDCGLLTHQCYAKNEFSERIQLEGSVLQAPSGTGLGFDDLLEALPWTRLT